MADLPSYDWVVVKLPTCIVCGSNAGINVLKITRCEEKTICYSCVEKIAEQYRRFEESGIHHI